MPQETIESGRMEMNLLDELMAHRSLDVEELGVRIRESTAYISGYVPNMKQKRLVSQIASRVEGVRDVVNMLTIVPLPVVPDDGIKKHISRNLARNPNVDDANLLVEVISGVVHLDGVVRTVAEKRFVEDEAWSAPGVKDVVCRVRVNSVTTKNEAQIAGEILQGFSYCLGLDLSNVAVELRGKVAHLKGFVPNNYLRAAAEELARWTPPVADVVNELYVLSRPRFQERLDLVETVPLPYPQGRKIERQSVEALSATQRSGRSESGVGTIVSKART